PDDGHYEVSVTVTTSTGLASTTGPVVIDVVNAAPAPEIVGAPSTSLALAPITLHALAHDPGAGDSHTFSWSVDTLDGNVAAGTGPDFTFTPTSNGIHTITLTANDGQGGEGSTQTPVLINGAAQFAAINVSTTGDEGTPIHATATINDIINSDNLIFAWSVTKNGADFGAGSAPTFDFTPDDNGLYVVRLRITAGTAASDATPVAITVHNVYPAVTITGVPTNPVSGGMVSLQAEVTARGAADLASETFQWSVVETNGQVVQGGTDPDFSFTPSAPGNYVIVLTVTDKDGGSATTAELLSVTQAAL